jgi:SAM-dependent methyltransferase
MSGLITITDTNRANLRDAYAALYDDGARRGAGSKFMRMSERYKEGYWERLVPKVGLFSRPMKGGVFLDFGCKFGHLTPLLMELSAASVFSVDVEDEHLTDGAAFIGARYNSEYKKSDDCYLDIPSNSVDFILANEVISHVNPGLLETFYRECGRILKVGGELVISDGNNFSHYHSRSDLIDWYSDWECGVSTEFPSNYETQRLAFLKRRFSDRGLSYSELEYYARNTSGLWGDRLIETVRRGLDGEGFVERAHRPGIPPIHPVYGTAMERAFYPLQVEMSLRTYGFSTQQLIGVSNPRLIRDEDERGKTKNFVIRGTKLPEDREALRDFARGDTPYWD